MTRFSKYFRKLLASENVEAWVIGGYVRDCLLGRDHPEKDIDIVVAGNGIDIARKAAKKLGPQIKGKCL